MPDYAPDQCQLDALATWRKHTTGEDELLHALMGLAGECGELVDLLKKQYFKPGFIWVQNDKHGIPALPSELGDISYYLRIICHIRELSFDEMIVKSRLKSGSVNRCVFTLNRLAGIFLNDYYETEILDHEGLQVFIDWYLALIRLLGYRLDSLLATNRVKLQDGHGYVKESEG